jgi:Pyruvate/2-oxoacid:ferredoxin oxidoreductase delta subunit
VSRTEGRNLRVVLYEGPGSTPLADQDRYQVLSSLLDNGFEVTRPIAGQEVAPPDDAPVLVLGLLDGEPRVTADHEVHFRNLAQVNALDAAREVREATGARTLDAWKPWFPVIDFDRCTNCMQCLTFCLFDVYGVDAEQKITVQNQDNCKTDCPACSRVCPEVAILFPKYGKGPINGDVVREQDIQREAMKVDISTLLGGDLYGSLRTRQREARKRFSTERDESKALLERKRCLGKLKKELDIPDEVLMTLPSAEDIEERAARAKAKLAKRQARSQTVNDSRPAPSETEWGI